MTSKPNYIDATDSLRKVDQLSRQFRIDRDARLENIKEELIAIFEQYKNQTKKIESPDSDAIFCAFRKEFFKGNYTDVINVGGLLDEVWLFGQKEAYGYYYGAKALYDKQAGALK